jgi:hypothetical protein
MVVVIVGYQPHGMLLGQARDSTVQYSTVQYSTVQFSTVQYSTVQYSTVQYLAEKNPDPACHEGT